MFSNQPAPEPSLEYTTNPGDHLVLQITCCTEMYIGEVTQSDPLRIKVMESGPYAHLRDEDFIIFARESAIVQQDDRDNTCRYLEEAQAQGIRVASGLRSLNVVDDVMREILPG